MAGAFKKVEEGVGAGASALTAKANLLQAGDATAQAARVTGAAQTSKGQGVAGKAGKAVATRAAASKTGQRVATAAASKAPGALTAVGKALSSPAAAATGKVVSGLARFAPWVAGANAAVGAVRGGYDAYEKGGGALDVAKGAAWGAADQVTVGLASWAYGKGGQAAKGLGNAIAPSAQAAETGVAKKQGWSEHQAASENRATSHEIDSSGNGAVDVAKGGYHPEALRFYEKADGALYQSRKARGIQGTPMPGEGQRAPGLVQQPSNAKARERAAQTELGKRGVKEGTDAYHEGMQHMRAGRVPKATPSSAGAERSGSLSPDQSRAFNAAQQHYADSHMTGHADKQPPTYGDNGDGRKGFQIPKVQAAAQSAKGNKYEGPDE